MKIAVIGSGSWGCAAAILLAKKGYDVYLWSWQQEETDRLNRDRENTLVLPGKKISLPYPFLLYQFAQYHSQQKHSPSLLLYISRNFPSAKD